MSVAQLPEKVGAAFRPMQLVQVDPVGLQTPKAVIERGADLFAIESRLTVANVCNAVAGSRDLRGYDPVGSVAPALEVISYVLLSGCVGFRARRHRVHLGRIYEVDEIGRA